ncbi:MAG: hypothetical protein IJR46_07400 [Neisseriaceae bacterium]|nr:hypothetical protein [Neisseriaceae bacterium]
MGNGTYYRVWLVLRLGIKPTWYARVGDCEPCSPAFGDAGLGVEPSSMSNASML